MCIGVGIRNGRNWLVAKYPKVTASHYHPPPTQGDHHVLSKCGLQVQLIINQYLKKEISSLEVTFLRNICYVLMKPTAAIFV